MTINYSLERSPQVEHDLRAILQFLIRSHFHFGQSFASAKKRAAKRIARIEDAMESLAKAPHRGTRKPELLLELRSVTKDAPSFSSQ